MNETTVREKFVTFKGKQNRLTRKIQQINKKKWRIEEVEEEKKEKNETGMRNEICHSKARL